MTGKPTTRGVLLVAIVVLAVTTGTAMGAWNGYVQAEDNSPGATTTYTFGATVTNTTTTSSVVVNFQYADIEVEDVARSDIERFGIDVNGDFPPGNINTDLNTTPGVAVTEVAAQNFGRSLFINLSGSVTLNPNDELVLVLSGMTNPDSAGDYPILIDAAPEQPFGSATGHLNIEEEQTTTTTTTSTTTTESGDFGPGFSVALAALAFLAAALIALRRT